MRMSNCPSNSLSACLPACLPVCLSVCLPVSACLCLPACLPACLSVCLSLSVYQPVCLSVCLSVRPFVCLSVCLSKRYVGSHHFTSANCGMKRNKQLTIDSASHILPPEVMIFFPKHMGENGIVVFTMTPVCLRTM